MKKTLTSAGLVILGAASFNAQAASAPSSTYKPLTVSASLRGFYDDNYATAPSDTVRKQESLGLEATASLAYSWVGETTSVKASYSPSIKWFEARDNNSTDVRHQFDAGLSHRHSEQTKLEVKESFVIAQEPELTEGGTPLRTDGDYTRNLASVTIDIGVNDLVDLQVGYGNTIVDYSDPAFEANLNRMEHAVPVNIRWQLKPQTSGILGYQYSRAEYDAAGSIRNSESHSIYAGVDHGLSTQLSSSIRAGAQFTTYPDAVTGEKASSPYVDASLTYRYGPESTLQLGLKHARQATDIADSLDQKSTTVYGAINQRLAPKLLGSLLAQYQHSSFKDRVPANGIVDSENLFGVGLNVGYQINPTWSADAGYSYDHLSSDDANRSYTRNRVYVGVSASF